MADDVSSDPIIKALQKSTIAQTLKAARASLAEPSRPYTPLDRSLFQRPNEGSDPRPSSSYGVDQLAFVRDTFGNTGRPESARSSRSSRTRPDTIAEEDGPHSPEILRLDGEAAESSSEELTPVVAVPSPPAPSRGPAKPPRPPVAPGGASGYPNISALKAGGGYPDPFGVTDASPRRGSSATSASPRRRLADGSPRRRKGSQSPSPVARAVSSDSLPADIPLKHAPGEVVLTKLQSLAASKEKRKQTEFVSELCERTWVLATDMKAGKSPDMSLAPRLLREVMGLMDMKDLKESKLIFKLARCALVLLSLEVATQGVPVSGVQAAYQNISQVLFKYSQKEGNDTEFLSEKLIEPLLEVLESESPACSAADLRVYIVGILKNVSNDTANQKFLAQRGAVGSLFKLLDPSKLVGGAKEAPLLIQVTATLRNLASNQYKQFLTTERLTSLTKLMEAFPNHVELLTNIARILSKLTLHSSAVEAMAKSDAHIRQIARTVSSNMDSSALTLRLSFVLGNLTERSDRLRVVFAFDCEGTALVPQLLSKYWQKDRQLARGEVETEKGKASAQDVEEVLVKLVRLLANIAISPDAGATLAASSAVVDPLLDMLGAKKISDSEELVLNVVAAVTNLLFYDVPSNMLFQEESKQLLCRLFRPLLLESYNVEALVETARALGNLSRHADARKCMVSLRLDEILAILLDHDDRDLVFYSCGALVNLAADPECTPRLTGSTPAVEKLGKLLGDAPTDDPLLQLVAVKVLTNLSLDSQATWSATDIEAVRSALLQTIAESKELASISERQQLIELAQQLVSRLPESPDADPGSALDGAAKDWFYCTAPGCGRRFGSQEKLSAHFERRHGERNAGG